LAPVRNPAARAIPRAPTDALAWVPLQELAAARVRPVGVTRTVRASGPPTRVAIPSWVIARRFHALRMRTAVVARARAKMQRLAAAAMFGTRSLQAVTQIQIAPRGVLLASAAALLLEHAIPQRVTLRRTAARPVRAIAASLGHAKTRVRPTRIAVTGSFAYPASARAALVVGVPRAAVARVSLREVAQRREPNSRSPAATVISRRRKKRSSSCSSISPPVSRRIAGRHRSRESNLPP
jgi:hypothetical protein